MHLRWGKFRLAGNVNGGIPYAARDAAHLHGGIAHKRQRPQPVQNALIQNRRVLPLETTVQQIKMDGKDMPAVQSCIHGAQVEQRPGKERRHRKQQKRQADLSGE